MSADMGPLPLVALPSGEQRLSERVEQAATVFRGAQPPEDPEALRRAAQEFEGYFIAYLMKEMRQTVPKGLIDNKAGEQFYTFYDQEIGRLAAQAGGLGLATQLEAEMLRLGPPPGDAQVSRPSGR